MAGPRIQMPGPLVEMFHVKRDEAGEIESFTLKPEWAAMLSSIQQVALNGTRSGSTAARPTSSTFRWVGMPFFDQTLGQPVFLKYATSNVWITADGTVA